MVKSGFIRSVFINLSIDFMYFGSTMSGIDQPELPPYVIPGNYIYLFQIIKQRRIKDFFYLR